MADQVSWIPPRPLSGPVGSAPEVLVFKTDDFMDELEAALAAPDGLTAALAKAETWRDGLPQSFPAPTTNPPSTSTGDDAIKLYQPAHGWFYLVAAQLVCRRYGQPDRRTGPTEETGFVVRRLFGTVECAWVMTDGAGQWVPRPLDSGRLADGEDVLPLAPTTYEHRGRRTYLLTGLVPVAARETYEAWPPSETEPQTEEPSAAEMAVVEAVVQPLIDLRNNHPFLDGEREALTFALVDLVDWLVASGEPMDLPRNETPTYNGVTPWGDLLTEIRANRDGVLDGTAPELVSSVTVLGLEELLLGVDQEWPDPDPETGTETIVAEDTTLGIELKAMTGQTLGPPPGPEEPGTDLKPDGDVRYVFRTVYQREDCARAKPQWLSDPTGPYRFASFFDSDAPARPVQIALPIDTSPAGLRKFPRNVSVLLSDQLRSQMDRVKDGFLPLGGSTFSLGVLCTMSIPIITICALILLMIMVSILNMIFWWKPFFKICLPQSVGEES